MSPIIAGILPILSKFIGNQEDKYRLEAELAKHVESGLQSAVNADKEIRLAELSKGGLAAVWRPIAALSLTSIIWFYYILLPLAEIWLTYRNDDGDVLWAALEGIEPLPDYFWIAYISFISIYVAGRSMEKRSFNFMRGFLK